MTGACWRGRRIATVWLTQGADPASRVHGCLQVARQSPHLPVRIAHWTGGRNPRDL